MRSRVIRIDEEVWAELQRRARPFEDNPNAVIRKVLGLPAQVVVKQDSINNVMDSRVVTLLDLVSRSEDEHQHFRPTETGNFAILSDQGNTCGYIYPQKRRLKVEIRKDWVDGAGLTDWDHELPDGWFHTGISSVYWYLNNNDNGAYNRVAIILMKILR
ncbi:hypothetical protein KA005_28195 [bacterium]|jgi:hypothetical protein|nr:hypothetical protein [bacterium]